MVGSVGHGQVVTTPGSHLLGIGTRGIDHQVAGNVALFGDYPPAAVGFTLDVGNPVVPNHGSTHVPGALDHAKGCTGRINVAIVRSEQCSLYAVEIEERMAFCDLFRVQNLHRHTQPSADAQNVAYEIHLVVQVGNPHGTTAMPADRLTGFGFQFLVELNAILVDLGEAPVGQAVGDLTGGVPGRAAGQLRLLDQNAISPAFFAQVIQQAGTHNSAADNDNPGFRFHANFPLET